MGYRGIIESQVEIAAELVHELDADGEQLRVVKFGGADELRMVNQLQELLYAP